MSARAAVSAVVQVAGAVCLGWGIQATGLIRPSGGSEGCVWDPSVVSGSAGEEQAFEGLQVSPSAIALSLLLLLLWRQVILELQLRELRWLRGDPVKRRPRPPETDGGQGHGRAGEAKARHMEERLRCSHWVKIAGFR
eukprot:Hpha_TRINITY_DN33005_c0_g1::TRINITY_DN33005_c0_g1_i1::g.158648::m.158648